MDTLWYFLIGFTVCTGILWALTAQRRLIRKDLVMCGLVIGYCALAVFLLVTKSLFLSALPVFLIVLGLLGVALRRIPAVEDWFNKPVRLP